MQPFWWVSKSKIKLLWESSLGIEDILSESPDGFLKGGYIYQTFSRPDWTCVGHYSINFEEFLVSN